MVTAALAPPTQAHSLNGTRDAEVGDRSGLALKGRTRGFVHALHLNGALAVLTPRLAEMRRPPVPLTVGVHVPADMNADQGP